MKRFNGGEGCWYQSGVCYFTTKGDNRVWAYNAAASTIELAYDDSLVNGTAPLVGVDNVTGSSFGDLYVAEDGGNIEICLITDSDVISVFARISGQSSSEICIAKPDNAPSLAVMRRIGMVHIGRTARCYGLVAELYKAGRPNVK